MSHKCFSDQFWEICAKKFFFHPAPTTTVPTPTHTALPVPTPDHVFRAKSTCFELDAG